MSREIWNLRVGRCRQGRLPRSYMQVSFREDLWVKSNDDPIHLKWQYNVQDSFFMLLFAKPDLNSLFESFIWVLKCQKSANLREFIDFDFLTMDFDFCTEERYGNAYLLRFSL